jgi:hypothetical protein
MSTSLILRPGVSRRRGADRHQTRIGWLHGRHSFDTGIDPLGADTRHGVLVVTAASWSGDLTPIHSCLSSAPLTAIFTVPTFTRR